MTALHDWFTVSLGATALALSMTTAPLTMLSLDGTGAIGPGSVAANPNELIDQFQHHYQTTKSFTAKFDETLTRTGAPPLKRSGLIYYQKPGKLRWEFEGSQPEVIVSDGKMLYDYDPELNQVVETVLDRAFRSQAGAALLLGAGNVRRDFTAKAVSAPDSRGLVHVILIPKNGGEHIEAGIDSKTYNIAELTIDDAMGNRTQLSFSNIELNQPMRASLFMFTPPSGADIVGSQGIQ
jgi:outer membrane lipoprotein carrier protein